MARREFRQEEEEEEKKEVRLLLLVQLFLVLFFSVFFLSLYFLFVPPRLSLSLSSSTFLSSATYHKRSGVMKTCTIHVRQVSLFLHRTDGGAGPVRPLYYFLFFFFF